MKYRMRELIEFDDGWAIHKDYAAVLHSKGCNYGEARLDKNIDSLICLSCVKLVPKEIEVICSLINEGKWRVKR